MFICLTTNRYFNTRNLLAILFISLNMSIIIGCDGIVTDISSGELSQPLTSEREDTLPVDIPFQIDSDYDSDAAVTITEDTSNFFVKAAKAIQISKNDFNIIVDDNSTSLQKTIDSSIKLNGVEYSIAPPVETSSGKNWVELRGWFSESSNLWYVARYRFWPDKPFVHLALSVMDRHDNHPTEAQWSSLWEGREISDFVISLDTGKELPQQLVNQTNSFSGGKVGTDAVIEEVTASGNVHWQQRILADSNIQLIHTHDNTGGTYVRIYPMYSGNVDLVLNQSPLSSPYPAANAVTVKVHHASGDAVINNIDQGLDTNVLGAFTLDKSSYLDIVATGESGDKVVFEQLKLMSSNQIIKTVQANRVGDHVLDAGQYGLVVKDFWKKFPIEARVESGRLITRAVTQPVKFVGGSGLTIELGINLDNTVSNTDELSQLLNLPPKPSFPDWWHPLDGQNTQNEAYTALLNKTAQLIHRNDEVSGNYGWKNWGDYQIGGSFFNPSGIKVEDWGALQYDLGLGLILAWMQTGDNYLWNRSRAAVRNIMDIQTAKFEPYAQKRSGAGLRKGQCEAPMYHWCQEPIPEFNYHTRSLLLYSHITGEAWPKDIAQMLIDNSAYFSHTRTTWTVNHARIISWALRNLYYGAVNFPEGTKYNEKPEQGFPEMPVGTSYKTLLNNLVNTLVAEVETIGRIPGDQPVWQAQIIEGLIIAVESGLLEPVLENRARTAITTSMDYFIKNHLRSDGKGGYEMMYIISSNQWTNAATYGWFWLNNLMWTTKNTSKDYSDVYTGMYTWLSSLYNTNTNYQTTRAWSGVLAFPSYFVGNLRK